MRDIPPWFGLGAKSGAGRRRVVVLGCPFEDPDMLRNGCAEAPAAIRRWARTAEAVDERGAPVDGVEVVDVGDVEAAAVDSGAAADAIRAAAADALREHRGAFLLGLGGDHGVTPPLAAAVAAALGPERSTAAGGNGAGADDANLAFVLLDAHPDCFETYGGRRDSHASVLPRTWEVAAYTAERTALVGLRSYGLDELGVMSRAALTVPARAWSEQGTEAVFRAIDEVVGDAPVYVSVDIDVLDPACAPGTGYPIAGGPTSRELFDLLRRLFRERDVVGMDVVEVSPRLDPSGITAATAAHLCLQCLSWL